MSEWTRRHRQLVWVVWLHAGVLVLFGTWFDSNLLIATAEVSPVAMLAVLAGHTQLGPRIRSTLVGAGLVMASALLVFMSDGSVEAHFQFFVVIGLMALYQDWVPFGVTVALSVAYHGVIGPLDPESVYNHPAALERPWLFGLIYVGALLAFAGVWVVTWQLNPSHLLYDGVTGLPTRSLLALRLESLAGSADDGHPALLAARVDDLAILTQAYGHAESDRVLREVATRMWTVLGPTATIARAGNDEFAAIVTGLPDERAAEALARRVQRALADPIELAGGPVVVTASIGVAMAWSSDGPASLLRNADLALEAAKRSGRGACVSYEPSMLDEVQARWQLEVELAEAFEHQQFAVWYQPIVDLRSGRMEGVEALVRWEHPERGVVAPDDFLPAVEETGRLPELTRFVLREATGWVQRRLAQFPDEPPLKLAVNVSPRELTAPEVVDDVAVALTQSRLDSALLTLEITESLVFEFINVIAPMLRTLRAAGTSIALDDFGTGFSSLSHLRWLPVDVVKIDRSFVDGIATELEGSTVVAAVIRLAHTLNLVVVAEGVEDLEQLSALQALGCEFAQGYLLARPAPPDEVPSPSEIQQRMAEFDNVVVDLRAASNGSDGQPLRVVVADDSEDDRRLLRGALARSGRFAVVGDAPDGLEALRLAVTLNPDVVLLDWDMPGMDGLSALPLILAASPATRVVVLSGRLTESLRSSAGAAGAAGCLDKRFADVPDRLLAILAAVAVA